MANPPFNQKDWRATDELTDDPRWTGYETPPTGNANYAWILHMVSKLSESGSAGFILANGSMSSNTSGEDKIRQQLINNDLIDCMIALPGQLFYTVQIPVCLWFLRKNKSIKPPHHQKHHDRTGQTLFIDAREFGTMISRVQKGLTVDDIKAITTIYHNWQQGENYQDTAGLCKSANLADIKHNDYILTPGRYVGIKEEQQDPAVFEEKMQTLSKTLFEQMDKAQALDKAIKQNLQILGYREKPEH